MADGEEEQLSLQGNVFHIQRFTIHDGPGLRTELFLKGCPLKCRWCSNPESWRDGIQVGVYATKCISEDKCGACKKVCPIENVLQFKEGLLNEIHQAKCSGCLACQQVCPSDAIKQWGKMMTVDSCMEVIRKDKGYYERSGGGVTVSGGEPLLQSDFVAQLFLACKEEKIQTCCESSFHVSWGDIEKVIPVTDLFISDIKHMDSAIHKKYTGAGNELILENLVKLAKEDKDLILRIPVIPNVNDDMENIQKTADFIINELGGRVRTLQLLSFMRLGEEKYKSLGMSYPMKDVTIDREKFQEHVNEIADYMNKRGIHCLVGTKEKE